MDVQDYAIKYLDKPNPSTGRSFWFDGEVAQAEKMLEMDVAKIRNFCQTCIAKGITDPAKMQVEWNKASRPPTPTIKSNVLSEDLQPIGTMTRGEFWTRLKKELDDLG